MLDDEVALGNENRYKNFVAALEKVLKQFEPSSDWPNLIIYLNRLKKVRCDRKKAHCNVEFCV